MERILNAVLLLALLAAGFAQTSPSATGAPCTTGLGSSGNVYDFSTYLKCCSELAQPTITTAADCETYCTSQNQPWIYGYFRNATYDTCVCLPNCVDVPSDVSQGDYRQLVETSQTPNTTVTDLISSAPDFVIDVNSTQVTLSPNQTAIFQTNTNIEGNMIHFIAMPSVSGLSAGSIIGFTVRDLYDFRTITPTVTFRNNSFEISCLLYYYDPPVQYKRQSSASDTFTYTMKNLGDRVLVVLSAGGQAVVSWYYEPIASNTDNTTTTLANSFTFDLAFEQSTSLAYQSCTDNLCYDSTLHVCQNGTNTETKFCYMGCDSDGLDCVQCNSDTCQGTCAANSTTPQCVCSGTNIGAGCQTDLATSTFYLSGSYDYNNQRYVTVSFDISNCVVGENCATVSYLYIGTTNSSSGSCCTAQLNFAALDVSPQSGTILTFNREGDWTCFNGDELTLDPSLLDSYFELSFPMTDSVSWSWNEMTLETSTQSLYTCNSDITNLSQPEKVITTLILEVGLPFLCASCVAVAIGFLVGMRTAPNGMTVKRKEPLDKGCVPRNNDTMAQSIIAIIVLDVSLVTSFNIIGLIFPVSMAVLASGVILIIMTYQIDQVGARVGRKPRTVHKLQTVQRVFGRISGAFLILLGAVVFVVGLAFFVYGNLTTIIYYISPLIGWFVLAIYLTWSLVIVHFVAAIYVSVCFFFTAVRTDEQESIRAHNIELDERPDNIEL